MHCARRSDRRSHAYRTVCMIVSAVSEAPPRSMPCCYDVSAWRADATGRS